MESSSIPAECPDFSSSDLHRAAYSVPSPSVHDDFQETSERIYQQQIALLQAQYWDVRRIISDPIAEAVYANYYRKKVPMTNRQAQKFAADFIKEKLREARGMFHDAHGLAWKEKKDRSEGIQDYFQGRKPPKKQPSSAAFKNIFVRNGIIIS